MSILAYLLGFLAATSNAGSNVLQRAANRERNQDLEFSWEMVRNLLHSKKWLGGLLCMLASFLLQATGLGFGTLSAVEPLLVLELPITMVASHYFLGARIGPRGWATIGGMTLSTIALIAVLGPGPGRTVGISLWVYAVAITSTAGAIGICYWLGWRWHDLRRRAAVLGVGTGIAYGMAAALTKGMTLRFSHHGLAGVLTAWQLYGAIATGAVAVWMHQNAVNSAALVVAQPGITLADPYVSILWGAVVFAEPMRGGLWVLPAVVAGVCLSVSAVELSRIPAVLGAGTDDEAPADAEADYGPGLKQIRPEPSSRC